MKKHLSNLYIFLILLFLYLPIFILIILSFNEARFGSMWTGFTLEWYKELFQDKEIITSLKITVIVALSSSVIAVILGTLAAIGIDNMNAKHKALMNNLTYIPMINPDIVIGVSLLSLFSLLKFIKLGMTTLILAHVTFCLPYVIFAVLPKLKQLDPHLQEAAYDLGASPWQAFSKVILPEIMPGIVSGFLMSVTISLDDFIVSFFTTGSGVSTLSITIYSMTKRGISPKINALTTIMFAVLLTLMIINYLRDTTKERQGYIR